MNTIQQFRRIDRFFHVNKLEKVLLWGASLFLLFCSLLVRSCISTEVLHTKDLQDRITGLWLLMACLTWLLIDYRLAAFQKQKLNWFKMMGISNSVLFTLAAFDCRIIWILFATVFAIINIFFVEYSPLGLITMEGIMFIYLVALIYYLKVKELYRVRCLKIFHSIKRIVLYCCASVSFVVIFLGDTFFEYLPDKCQWRAVSRFYEEELEELHAGPKIVKLFLFIGITLGYYYYYIKKHELYGESVRTKRMHNSSINVRDGILQFRGSRWCSLIKLNYLGFRRNKNNTVAKAIFMLIWCLFVCFCKEQRMCLIAGMFIVVLLAPLILYRFQDEQNNAQLYESIGLSPRKSFKVYCICGGFYLYNTFLFLGIVGIIRGNLSILQALILLCWLSYQIIYTVSFNLYYIYIRKKDVGTPFYEMFGIFLGALIGATPVSLFYPITLWICIRKQENQYKEMCGEEIVYDVNQ